MQMEEMDIVKMIAISGDSKAKAFEALKCLKQRDIARAKELIKESRQLDLEAHNLQTNLISKALMGEEDTKVTLLMVHAQDHYMTSQLARDLIEAMIALYE
ncbi:PTS lactose/cellobiose transporter subunit IIA [Streptococcus sp. zg-86]|uniref:PTS lactose/cellobiose transporter subunit IIA n=2 Tax=Streptococcus TaxID=1301 RepID=A0A6I4RHM0_9STRE|nr:PTS lactose/cellobiose transporter subunit IIA [Streptococcus sp. zg-86]MTB90333.1 PTS lactose/cellobiose transporter subunit IIA [Streptococcus sp. zg-36]MWV56011.1 PTS lactose/cellobiose transporter subunit IIA [Streptococcus sp. zg-70]